MKPSASVIEALVAIALVLAILLYFAWPAL